MTSSGLATTRRPAPVVLADLIPGSLVRDMMLVAGGAGLIGALAQISIHLSFTPVPMTGQTLAVLLVGTTLGMKRGVAAATLYAIAGLIGVPWFADHQSGYVGASFGYILGFILCAMVCGFLSERHADRRLPQSAGAMLVGEIAIYAVGVTWLGIYLHTSLSKAVSLGLTPFVWGDLLKAAIATVLLPATWYLVKRLERS